MYNNCSAPEIWENLYQKAEKNKTFFYEPSCDVYSIGMILWEIETNKVPFNDKDESQIYKILVEK